MILPPTDPALPLWVDALLGFIGGALTWACVRALTRFFKGDHS